MTQRFEIKQNDVLPVLPATLNKPDKSAMNLTGASVQLRIRAAKTTGAPKFTKNCVVTNAVGGQVEYRWAGTDTSTPGTYEGEFIVTWGNGDVQTVPNSGNVVIVIHPTLTP
jgi:hypothetical protein